MYILLQNLIFKKKKKKHGQFFTYVFNHMKTFGTCQVFQLTMPPFTFQLHLMGQTTHQLIRCCTSCNLLVPNRGGSAMHHCVLTHVKLVSWHQLSDDRIVGLNGEFHDTGLMSVVAHETNTTLARSEAYHSRSVSVFLHMT